MRVLVATAVALACLQHGQAQAQVPNDPNDVAGALNELQSAVNRLPAELSSPGLRSASDWFIARPKAASFDARTVSSEYARALRSAAALLKGRPSREVVDDVTAELEAKVEHCRKLGVPMGGAVTLKVNTLRNGQAIGNLRVKALLKIYEHVQGSEPRSFLRVSSPTQMDLEPGRYWVWALDESTQKTSERVLVRVTGQKELILDLPAP